MVIEPAPLQLEGYYVRRLAFSIRPNADDRAELALATGLHVQIENVMTTPPYTVNMRLEAAKHKTDNTRLRVLFGVSVDEKDDSTCPYVFNLELIGYFKWAGPKPTPQADIFIIRNASMVLYSACREILASATARGPFPALVLPTYAFTIEEPDLVPPTKKLAPARSQPTSSSPRRKRPPASKKR